MGQYVPRQPTFQIDPNLAVYLRQELQRVADSVNLQTDRLRLTPLAKEPTKPRPGDVVYADGANWDPGCGNGVYAYITNNLGVGVWSYMTCGCDANPGGGGSVTPPDAGPWRFFRLKLNEWYTGSYGGPFNPPGTLGQVRVDEMALMVGATKYPTSTMTGNSAPSPLVASASSSYPGYSPYSAFDNDLTDSGRWISDATNFTGFEYLQIDLGPANEITPDTLRIAPDGGVYVPAGNSFNFISAFQLLASNSGAFSGEEAILYTYANQDYHPWLPGNVYRDFPL